MRRARPRPRPEIRLDQLFVRQYLAAGSHGQVLLVDTRKSDVQVQAQRSGNLYAVKVSPSNQGGDPELLSRLEHDNIVAFYTFFRRGPREFFLFEHVPGGNLFLLLDRLGQMPPSMVRFYVASVLQALEYLHAHHVVHGGIKPENVLLGADGYVKVCGFAQAQVVLPRPPASPYDYDECPTPFVEQWPSPSVPLPLSRVELDEYTAPEVIRQTSYTPAIDFWALGIMLFELLAGHTPFAPDAQRRRTDVPLATSPWSDSTQTSNPASASGSGGGSVGGSAGTKHMSPVIPRAPWARPDSLLRDRILRGITGIDVVSALRAGRYESHTHAHSQSPDTGDSPAPAELKPVIHLLFGLLNSTPSLRLGTLAGGAGDVRRHLWFGARATASPIEPPERVDVWSQSPSRPQCQSQSPFQARSHSHSHSHSHSQSPSLLARRSSLRPPGDTEFDWDALATHRLPAPFVPVAPALVPAQGALSFADWEAGQDS